MQIICHRINTISQLKGVPLTYGAEIDIRYHNDRLVLAHDPFHGDIAGTSDFESWLKHYRLNGILILNLKTEGIEEDCITLMRKYGISRYFFLDMSMPCFVQYAKKAEKGSIEGFTPDHLAVRYSEEEPLEYALSFAGKARWIWVDCFTRLPLDNHVITALKTAGFKICLVSPELQKHNPQRIAEFKMQLTTLNVMPDAVCTKYPDMWENE